MCSQGRAEELRPLQGKVKLWRSHRGTAERNLTGNHEVAGSILGLHQWVKEHSVAVSCGVGRRHGSDPELLWLGCWPAAVAPIRPFAWKLAHASSVALKSQKQNKTKNLSNDNTEQDH